MTYSNHTLICGACKVMQVRKDEFANPSHEMACGVFQFVHFVMHSAKIREKVVVLGDMDYTKPQ